MRENLKIRENGKFSPEDTIFSAHAFMSINTRETCRNNHVFLTGPDAENIRETFLKPNILQKNSSYVIRDTTGDLLNSLKKPLEDAGYEIRVLNLANPSESNRYNPLHYFRDNEDIIIFSEILLKKKEWD